MLRIGLREIEELVRKFRFTGRGAKRDGDQRGSAQHSVPTSGVTPKADLFCVALKRGLMTH
jgi:hypothetical protein